MFKGTLALAAFTALALAACGGGGGYGGSTYTPPGGGGGGGVPSGVGANTIGIALPTGNIGVVADPAWGTVGGFTQQTYSQVLAFPVGTTITLLNLSSTTPHTLNVIGTAAGPPPSWPSAPSLPTTASGGALGAGFASGAIAPGASMNVTLSNAGTFLIACAFHYASNQMRDVIQVNASATPGPQATLPPSSGGGGCKNYC